MNSDQLEKFFEPARERYKIGKAKQHRADTNGYGRCPIDAAQTSSGPCRCDVCISARRDGPLTDDPVFQQYRFCNVFREDDKNTRWFRHNWRGWFQKRPADVVFATCVFRWFNRIETCEKLHELVLDWDEDKVRAALKDCKPLVTGAYLIKTPNGMSKLEGVLQILRPIWHARESLAKVMMEDPQHPGTRTLEWAWGAIRIYPFFGPFTAHQIVVDLRHTDVLRDAMDVMTWTCPGPGSGRGCGWVAYNDPTKFRYDSARDLPHMMAIFRELLAASEDPAHWPANWPRWEMADVQHWACECDKYCRGIAGERLKRRYP